MCGCEKHHNRKAECTCVCEEHGNFAKAYQLAMDRYDRIVELTARHDADIAAAKAAGAAEAALAFEAGVRQAIEWLRADYPYGDGPDWREHGCEWIADRLAEHITALTTGGEG